MGTIDTFRDFVGNVADDVKEAFDDFLDRPNRDDDCDWWEDDCDWWDDACCDDDEDDWDRKRRGRRGRCRTRQHDGRGRRGRRRTIVESGSRHPSLAESSRGGVAPELADQVRHLATTVEALRASLSAQDSPTRPENRA